MTDFDLTRKIVAATRPAGEPLRWMLHNPRAMRVTRQSDNLWIRLLDVPRALEARAYESGGVVTIAIEDDLECPHNVGTWRLEAGTEGATCTRSDAEADVTLEVQSLGSLYLGGMSVAILAGAGRIKPHHDHDRVLPLLYRLFCTDPQPFNSIGF